MSEQKVTTKEMSQITSAYGAEAGQNLPLSSGDTEADAGDSPAVGRSDREVEAMVIQDSGRAFGVDIARRLHQEGAGQDAALILGKMADAGHSLGQWAARYMLVKVCGRSKNTLAAKTRDLATFIMWFLQRHGNAVGKGIGADGGDGGRSFSGAGDIRQWTEADTRYFLRHLENAGRRAATINRALFTLKHFARYVHEQPGGVFSRHGFPVADVSARRVDEPECKKLSDAQVRALFAAARREVDTVTARQAAKNQRKGRAHKKKSRARPRRNLAMLGVLYYTGLRVSEMLALTRKQYDGAALYDVTRKGGRQARKLVLHPECARLIDYYVEYERDVDVAALSDRDDGAGTTSATLDASQPLFVSSGTGAALDRHRVRDMLSNLAEKVGAVAAEGCGLFAVHPHQLRHTFGALYRARSGSDTETAASLGHAGLQYVGRYVRQTDAERLTILQDALHGGEQ